MSNINEWKELNFKPIQVDFNSELEATVHIEIYKHVCLCACIYDMTFCDFEIQFIGQHQFS